MAAFANRRSAPLDGLRWRIVSVMKVGALA